MEHKNSKFHSLIMLGLCVYLTGAGGLLVYGLINATSRPYVIAFIAFSLLCSAYAASSAPLHSSMDEPPKENC